MIAAAHPTLTADTVSIGQQLPPLEHDVTATTVVLGALASRDWRPMHHDKAFAMQRNGVADIFINTPNNAAWFERYITDWTGLDWTGPTGRLGRMTFKMSTSVFPGDRMVFSGAVKNITSDAKRCCWLELDIAVIVACEVSTRCLARVAIPAHAGDNPWQRSGENWLP